MTTITTPPRAVGNRPATALGASAEFGRVQRPVVDAARYRGRTAVHPAAAGVPGRAMRFLAPPTAEAERPTTPVSDRSEMAMGQLRQPFAVCGGPECHTEK